MQHQLASNAAHAPRQTLQMAQGAKAVVPQVSLRVMVRLETTLDLSSMLLKFAIMVAACKCVQVGDTLDVSAVQQASKCALSTCKPRAWL